MDTQSVANPDYPNIAKPTYEEKIPVLDKTEQWFCWDGFYVEAQPHSTSSRPNPNYLKRRHLDR